jgi:hypothetical protein
MLGACRRPIMGHGASACARAGACGGAYSCCQAGAPLITFLGPDHLAPAVGWGVVCA